MKKYMLMGAGLCLMLAFTSCKSSEKAFRKAYDQAMVQGTNTSTNTDDSNYNNYNNVNDIPVVSPLTDNTYNDTRVTDNLDNEPVKSEDLSIINGSGLKSFSVVVGSFGVKANAEGLVERLRSQGYDAQLAYNAGNGMYRVIASSFNDKASAVQSRNALRDTYNGAWLLYKK